MTKVATITCNITDEYGGEYPKAFVAILDIQEYSHSGLSAPNVVEDYRETGGTDGLAYSVNYWYSSALVESKRSRPLKIEEDGVFSTEIRADIEYPAVAAVLNNKSLSPDDRKIKAVEADLRRRFT